MENIFRPGDRVRCVSYSDGWVRKDGCIIGHVYVVKKASKSSLSLNGHHYILTSSCFVHADPQDIPIDIRRL